MFERKFKMLIRGTVGLVLLASTSVFATNGMKMSSYGVRYGGMGGAGLALGGSVMDLEANPSQLARNKDTAVEFGINYVRPTLIYEDQFMPNPNSSTAIASNNPGGEYYHNKITGDSEVIGGVPGFPLPYLGYRTKIGENMGFGLAMYAEGGGGATTLY